MKEKEVYVFFDKNSYKSNKASVLETKIAFIKLQKRIRKIKLLRSKKKKNIILLKRYVDRLNNRFDQLYSHMGKDDLPQKIKDKLLKKEKKTTIKQPVKEKKIKMEKVIIIEKDDLSEELLKIQEQLKKLGV